MEITRRQFFAGLTAILITTDVQAPNYAEAGGFGQRRAWGPIFDYVLPREGPQFLEKADEPKSNAPNYAGFREMLKQKGKYDRTKERELRRFWNGIKEEGSKKALYEILDRPEDYIRKNFDEKGKQNVNAYSLREERKAEIKKTGFLWKVDGDKLDLSDKAYFYFIDEVLPEMKKAMDEKK